MANVTADQPSALARPGFWKRQFMGPATTPQIIFDVVFGVVGPVLCFVFDPIAFRGHFMGRPLYANFQIFVYLVSAIGIVVLYAWLFLGKRLSFGHTVVSGILFGCAILSATIGIVILPLSLLGLMVGIGIFGFTPFATSLVYFRNAFRAARSSSERFNRLRIGVVLLVSVPALGLPGLLSFAIHEWAAQSVDEIIHGDSQHAAYATQKLKPLRYFTLPELDKLVNAYHREDNPSHKQRLKDSYHAITGADIEARIIDLD